LPKSLNTLINCCTAPSSLLWPLARENWLLNAQGFLSWPLLASRLYQIICTHRKLLLWLLLPIGQWINSSAPPLLRSSGINQWDGVFFWGGMGTRSPLQKFLGVRRTAAVHLRHRRGNSSEKLCPPAVRANVSQ